MIIKNIDKIKTIKTEVYLEDTYVYVDNSFFESVTWNVLPPNDANVAIVQARANAYDHTPVMDKLQNLANTNEYTKEVSDNVKTPIVFHIIFFFHVIFFH